MCFILGKMKGLTYVQYLEYQLAVAIYLRVEAYNLNVYNQRKGGNLNVTYYNFPSTTEVTQYTQGRFLLVQNDPANASKYTPVEKI